MRIYLVFIFLFFSKFIWASEAADTINNELSICVEPLSILPMYSGTSVRGGIEYKLKENWSMYNELGYYINYFKEISYPKNVKGYTTKIELKNYRGDGIRNSGRYFSLELFLKHQNYLATDSIGIGKIKYGQVYSVSKNVGALTFKFGRLKVYKFGLVIDSYIGVGIRLKKTNNGLTETENENMISSADYGPNKFTNRAGNFIYPNFSLGFRIGYRIK
ncbi:MAG: hypothetical protein COB15_08660 [Flavobacteriales bacterium]|nr:MAG: hypothetical protein COB15_08660 [Flavobacteriales bacterium]